MPLSANQRTAYVEDAETFFSLMSRTRQWDALQPDAVQRWLDNFPTDELRYYACRVLRGLLYYSERDVETLLREALFHKVIGGIVRSEQRALSFGQFPSTLAYNFRRTVERTLLVPLVVADSPAESSSEVTRIAQQRLDIPGSRICYPHQIPEQDFADIDNVVIVDDNLGSGDQFREFWTTYRGHRSSELARFLASANASVFSLVLVANAPALAALRDEFPEVAFCCAQELPSAWEVFGNSSVYWPDPEEQTEAETALEAHLGKFGIPLKGYGAMSYALILHRTVPDWCLPALWQQAEDWTGTPPVSWTFLEA
jgi:hypothetical protein